MHKLKEKLMECLYEYEDRANRSEGKISDSEIQKIHILTDTVKNIDKIEKLESESDYSGENAWMGDGRSYGSSYARGGRGRGRNARRDSMGRYASDGSYYRYGGDYGDNSSYMPYYRDNGYSGADKDEMLRKLRGMIGEAGSEEEKEALRHCIRKMEEV